MQDVTTDSTRPRCYEIPSEFLALHFARKAEAVEPMLDRLHADQREERSE
jgi:hypothetical protein